MGLRAGLLPSACSLCEIFLVVAGQLSDSLKIFVRQKRKMPHKNIYRVLLCLNTGLFIFRKHYKFDGKKSKYTGNMCNLHPLKTKSSKYCLGIFLDYNFLSDILSAKLTKFAGHFQNLAVCPTDWRFSRRLSLSPRGGAYTRTLKSEK